MFTAWARVASNTVTGEGTISVHTLPTVLTGVGAYAALISVVVAGGPSISRWTVTVEHTSNGVGVTLRALSAGITDAGIIKMAEQTCLSVRTHADEGCNTVYACGALAACSCCTVINVFRAVRSTPTIDAYTDIAAGQVAAGTSVLTGVWLQPALIHVLCAVLTSPLWRTLTVVGIDPIHTGSSIGTLVIRAVVDVVLTVSSIETGKAVA